MTNRRYDTTTATVNRAERRIPRYEPTIAANVGVPGLQAVVIAIAAVCGVGGLVAYIATVAVVWALLGLFGMILCAAFVWRRGLKMNKLICKLLGHKMGEVNIVSLPDGLTHFCKCQRCGVIFWWRK